MNNVASASDGASSGASAAAGASSLRQGRGGSRRRLEQRGRHRGEARHPSGDVLARRRGGLTTSPPRQEAGADIGRNLADSGRYLVELGRCRSKFGRHRANCVVDFGPDCADFGPSLGQIRPGLGRARARLGPCLSAFLEAKPNAHQFRAPIPGRSWPIPDPIWLTSAERVERTSTSAQAVSTPGAHWLTSVEVDPNVGQFWPNFGPGLGKRWASLSRIWSNFDNHRPAFREIPRPSFCNTGPNQTQDKSWANPNTELASIWGQFWATPGCLTPAKFLGGCGKDPNS